MLVINGLTKTFKTDGDRSEFTAIADISLEIEQGEFVSIIGPSGAGKSTLLEIMCGLARPTSGTVSVDGHEIVKPSNEIGIVFQEDATFPWLTSKQNVEFGLEFSGVKDSRQRGERAADMLRIVGLSGFEHYYPRQLSGGMRQRVNLARVLASVPRVILLDEPFGSLDEQTRLSVGDELLEIWRKTGPTFILVTHSLQEAALLSDRIVVLRSKPGAIQEIVDNPLPRPRSSEQLGTAEFSELVGHLWRALKAGTPP